MHITSTALAHVPLVFSMFLHGQHLGWYLLPLSTLYCAFRCCCTCLSAVPLAASCLAADPPVASSVPLTWPPAMHHPYITLDALDSRLRRAEHTVARLDRQLRLAQQARMHLQNSAASGNHLNAVHQQVTQQGSRLHDLESAVDIVTPLGPQLRSEIAQLDYRVWSLERSYVRTLVNTVRRRWREAAHLCRTLASAC